jgi:hypothetical protein
MQAANSEFAMSPVPKNSESSLGKTHRKQWLSLRAIVSLSLLAMFLVLAGSGSVLFLSPKGQVARWTAWQVWGINREQWSQIHINSAGLILLLNLLHLGLNWRPLYGYVRRAVSWSFHGKPELLLATVLGGLCLVGSVRLWPGFQMLPQWRDRLRASWETHLIAPPVAHLEEWSLQELAAAAGIDPERLSAAAEELGAKELSLQSTLGDLGSQLRLSPNQVFEQLSGKVPELQKVERRPGQGRGLTRGLSPSLSGCSPHGQGIEGSGGYGPRGGGGGRGPGWGRGRRFQDSLSSPP